MMKVMTKTDGDREVATEDQKAEAMKLLEQGYLFYEVGNFDAPAISTPVTPDEMRDDQNYLAFMRFAGG